jgi:prophage regulatory protein
MMNNVNLENTTSKNSGFLRNRLAAEYLNISEVTLWRLSETDPDFPKKIRITKRCVGFLEAELDAYLELKKAA